MSKTARSSTTLPSRSRPSVSAFRSAMVTPLRSSLVLSASRASKPSRRSGPSLPLPRRRLSFPPHRNSSSTTSKSPTVRRPASTVSSRAAWPSPSDVFARIPSTISSLSACPTTPSAVLPAAESSSPSSSAHRDTWTDPRSSPDRKKLLQSSDINKTTSQAGGFVLFCFVTVFLLFTGFGLFDVTFPISGNVYRLDEKRRCVSHLLTFLGL